ncbi:MAG: hypothetical protein V4710_21140, partial [Verrucomicrobiota bacterium]
MKNIRITLTTIAVAAAFTASAFAHERITIGPKGGRVIYVDSTTIPNVEFLVNKESRAEIALLDKARKPIALDKQSITVTAGPRNSAKKLAVEKQGDLFVTEKVPEGAPYTVIVQVKESAESKPLTVRVNYDPTPAKSGKPDYLDDSVNEGSGPSIPLPESLDGLFREINQHHGELKENFAAKKYEALDEVTQALTVLLKAMPGKSGDKKAAVQAQTDALIKDLGVIAEANAARTLSVAAKNLESFNSGLAALQKNYP